MIYITGDTHGDFDRIHGFCKRMSTTKEDVMVILGDVGFNYHLDHRDIQKKERANKQDITWFCIKGNHEKYAGAIQTYKEKEAFGGTVYIEEAYPNIMFAKDGEIYTFRVNNQETKVLVIGGAYSVDKHYRVTRGLNWFEDEQPSKTVKLKVEKVIKKHGHDIDYIFSHTCPLRFEPIEWFLTGINQSTVDNSTEKWLDTIYDSVDVKRWYCGHYHGQKLDKNVRFMFGNYVEFGE